MTIPAPGVLASVDFGRLDAEQDEKLLDYFVEVGTASQALHGKYLVIGRKGAGKTALFKHVAASSRGKIVDLDLEDYVFQAHRGLKDHGVSDAFAYTASWRFAIAISMFLETRKSLGLRARWRGTRILRRIGAGPNRASLGAIVDWLKRIRKVELPSLGDIASLGGLELADPDERFMDTRTGQYLDELEDLLAKAAIKQPITALVDRLDDAWDGTKESLQLIGGAVRAARYFAGRVRQDGPSPVIVFLRTDLWEKISFNDKNKFIQDSVFLDWNDADLSRVIDERIHKTAGLSEGSGWAELFTTDRMRQGTTAQKYMLKRVLGRPRDIVAFAVFARETAISAGHQLIEKQDVYDAEMKYSKHILDELRDEISEHVSNPIAVVNTLKGLRRRTFSLADWEGAAKNNGIAADEINAVLDQLFEASIVGVLRTGGSSGGSKTVYRYQDRFLKAAETGNLQVHPALTKELGLTDA